MLSIKILIIDDSEGDVVLIKEAIEAGGIAHTVNIAGNGEQAIKMLQQKNEYSEYAHPDLILLDINMPRMNGHEVLDTLKADPALKHIPVIMLTTSSAKADILKSYQKYSNCYIVKPDEFNGFDKVVKAIENFWIEVAKLPS